MASTLAGSVLTPSELKRNPRRDLALQDVAFAGFQFQVSLSEASEKLFQALEMCVEIVAEDDDVIEVSQADLKIETSEHGVHKSLKCCWALQSPNGILGNR